MRSQRILAVAFSGLLFTAGGCTSGSQENLEEPAEGADEGIQEETAQVEEAIDDAAPMDDVMSDPAPSMEPEPAAEPAAPAEPAGFTGAKVTRYVTSFALNVRSAPDKSAPVVGHVKKGDKVEVIINGEWAKLDTGRYISNNRLATKNPGPSKP